LLAYLDLEDNRDDESLGVANLDKLRTRFSSASLAGVHNHDTFLPGVSFKRMDITLDRLANQGARRYRSVPAVRV